VSAIVYRPGGHLVHFKAVNPENRPTAPDSKKALEKKSVNSRIPPVNLTLLKT
jgi:hypothetical protein